MKEVFNIPKEFDKKEYVFQKVKERFPQINWIVDKKGKFMKCNFDMSDSVGIGLFYFENLKNIKIKS